MPSSDEFGASYVITRRGRPVARLVGIGCEDSPTRTSILSRMEKTNALLGAIGQEEPDFPDVWLERTSGAVSPLEEAGSSNLNPNYALSIRYECMFAAD